MNVVAEMTDDELRQRSLELAEKEHRTIEKRAKARTIILIIFMALCVVAMLVCCHQMGQGLDTTL